jgi:hypothetical protein
MSTALLLMPPARGGATLMPVQHLITLKGVADLRCDRIDLALSPSRPFEGYDHTLPYVTMWQYVALWHEFCPQGVRGQILGLTDPTRVRPAVSQVGNSFGSDYQRLRELDALGLSFLYKG